MQQQAQERLALFSPFRQTLDCVGGKDKVVFYLENNCLSAKDSLEKIRTFAGDLYEGKEIIFVEHVGSNHFQIQKKEKNSWDLTRRDVASDGRCGIVSTMVALKELGLISDPDFDQYIDNTPGSNKLKVAFCENGTQENRTKLATFLCQDIDDLNTKKLHQDKISTLLLSTDPRNWLQSDTIKEVLASKARTNANIKIFGDNTQYTQYYSNEEEALLLKVKDTKFEVATVLLGLLAQKFQGRANLGSATDLTKLLEGEDTQLRIKLGFPEGRKVEFSDIFPIAETREKVQIFYTDNRNNVSSFLQVFDDLELTEANLLPTNKSILNLSILNLFKNVGLLLHQIDHIKKTQPGYQDIPDITESKKKWDALADIILNPNNHINDELKKDIRAIRERWGVGEYEERLAGTVEKAKQATKAKDGSGGHHDGLDDSILTDLMNNFTDLKNSGSIPDREIFLSTCQIVSSQASGLKGKDEFLKSFANFFFDNLENFYAIGDIETARSAVYDNFKTINPKLKKAGVKNLEDFLDDTDPRKEHYRQQVERENGFIVLTKNEPVVEEKLQQFSFELLKQDDKYIENLHKKIEEHFKKEGTFSEKINKLGSVFTGDVLESYAEFFSKIDSPLIPDSIKPIPKHAYSGWGKKMEIVPSDELGGFSLILDGKKIEKIDCGGQDKLEFFRSITDEKLRSLEITNFFRTASKDISIYYESDSTPIILTQNEKNFYKVGDNGQIQKSNQDETEKAISLKEKLQELGRKIFLEEEGVSHPHKIPDPSTSRRSSDKSSVEPTSFFETVAGVLSCGTLDRRDS
jgi:hypothetical protein